jgi:tRNA-specific 2-thiouridylase
VVVVVAMSGGVDSSVAAALLQRQGHEVVGVTMQIWQDEGTAREERRGGCCALGAVRDARAVATRLGIPYYVFDLREVFAREVVRHFADSYAAGRTPNPCVACNRHIKFAALAAKARRLGADALATGHYARLTREADGGLRLRRAKDRRKDQSYVLHPLPRAELGFFLFPLGEMASKEETRARARELGLPVAEKPDSQEICFVGADGYAAVVAARHPEALEPGPILDVGGRVIGRHRGLARYTVGQRRGLGLDGQAPRFVLAIDPARNALVVGDAAHAHAAACVVGRINWLAPPPPPGTAVTAQVRAGPGEHAARVFPEGEGVRVVFDPPVRAVTPGQACVLYDGDVVLGGGEIDGVEAAAPSAAVALPATAP